MEADKKSCRMVGSGVIIFAASIIGFLIILASVQAIIHQSSTLSPANICFNNLFQINGAANQFAIEHNLTNGAPINFPDDLTPYIKLNSEGKIRPCPSGGIYHISKVGETPTCSLGTSIVPAHVLP